MKTTRHIFLTLGFLFFGSVYFWAESPNFLEQFGDMKPDEGIFSTDRYRFGDLFGLSYISHFKEKQKPECTYISDTCNSKKNISLYILGDSYSYKFFTEKNFCGINKLTIVNWDEEAKPFIPDSSCRSVLIIETTERYVRTRFIDQNIAANKIYLPQPEQSMISYENASGNWRDYFSEVNGYLDALLFDYPLFTPVKQIKANLNYNLFHRVPDAVTPTINQDRLFLTETIADSLKTSSFSKVEDKEILNLVMTMNTVREHYLHCGFSEVYFSFIPNPVSLFEPQRGILNHFIERIQNNPENKFPVIDCYSLAKQNPEKFFRKSDTHWTTYGCNLWARRANEILNEFRNQSH